MSDGPWKSKDVFSEASITETMGANFLVKEWSSQGLINRQAYCLGLACLCLLRTKSPWIQWALLPGKPACTGLQPSHYWNRHYIVHYSPRNEREWLAGGGGCIVTQSLKVRSFVRPLLGARHWGSRVRRCEVPERGNKRLKWPAISFRWLFLLSLTLTAFHPSGDGCCWGCQRSSPPFPGPQGQNRRQGARRLRGGRALDAASGTPSLPLHHWNGCIRVRGAAVCKQESRRKGRAAERGAFSSVQPPLLLGAWVQAKGGARRTAESESEGGRARGSPGRRRSWSRGHTWKPGCGEWPSAANGPAPPHRGQWPRRSSSAQ